MKFTAEQRKRLVTLHFTKVTNKTIRVGLLWLSIAVVVGGIIGTIWKGWSSDWPKYGGTALVILVILLFYYSSIYAQVVTFVNALARQLEEETKGITMTESDTDEIVDMLISDKHDADDIMKKIEENGTFVKPELKKSFADRMKEMVEEQKALKNK